MKWIIAVSVGGVALGLTFTAIYDAYIKPGIERSRLSWDAECKKFAPDHIALFIDGHYHCIKGWRVQP